MAPLIQFLLFFLISLFFFLIPGLFLLRIGGIKKTKTEDLFISLTVGICLYSLISLILHYLGKPNLTIIYVISVLFLLIRKGIKLPKIKKDKKKILIFSTILTIGVIGQLLIIAPSGIKNKNGDLIFFSANGHDGTWHITLMNELQKEFPPQNPDYAGEKLKNYHFLSDLAPSDINHLFKISKIDLYFRFFPLLYSIILGSLAYFLGKTLSKSYWGGIGAMFFTYFAGSFGYIVTFIKNKTIGGESIFWSSQIQSLSGNPPQALALIIILSILLSIVKYFKKREIIWLIFIALLTTSLPLIKIYAWVPITGSLIILSLYTAVKEKNYNFTLLTLITILVSLALYSLSVSNPFKSKSFLILKPWWYIRTMVVEPSRLNLIDWELRRQTYLYEKNFLRVAQIEIQSFLIFLIGNLGTRILAFYWLIKERKKIISGPLNISLITISMISFAFPLIFIQKGVAGNTIQTLQYFLLILGIIAGVSLFQLIKDLKNKWIKILIPLIIITISVPTQIALICEFYSKPPLAKISKYEIEALEFIKNNTPKNSVIISPPFDPYSKFKNQATPDIWAWFDTSYISALSERKAFFADYEQMDIMGYDINTRKKVQEEIFKTSNQNIFKKLIKENSIDYIYLPKRLKENIELPYEILEKVFDNEETEIWTLKQ